MMYSLVGTSDRDAIGYDQPASTPINQSAAQASSGASATGGEGASTSARHRRGRTNEAMTEEETDSAAGFDRAFVERFDFISLSHRE